MLEHIQTFVACGDVEEAFHLTDVIKSFTKLPVSEQRILRDVLATLSVGNVLVCQGTEHRVVVVEELPECLDSVVSYVFDEIAHSSEAVSVVFRGNLLLSVNASSFHPDAAIARKLGAVGGPISFQELAVRISFLYLTMMMNSAGLYGAAVVGIGAKYDVFAMLSATSMANALAAITAQNIGRGKAGRARTSLWLALSFALGVSFLFWLWAQLSPETMIGAFTTDENVIKAGIPYFRTASYDYMMTALVFTLNGYLNGRQKTLWTMVSCTFGALLLRIPMVWIFSRIFGSDLGALGIIAPTVSGIMAFYTFIYVIWEGHKKKQIDLNPAH